MPKKSDNRCIVMPDISSRGTIKELAPLMQITGLGRGGLADMVNWSGRYVEFNRRFSMAANIATSDGNVLPTAPPVSVY